MAGKTVLVELIWMPDVSHLPELRQIVQNKSSVLNSKRNVLGALRQFLKRSLDVQVNFKDVRLITSVSHQSADDNESGEEEDIPINKKSKPSSLLSYTESLFVVPCELVLESTCEKDKGHFENCKMNLINLFCSKKFVKEAPECWLAMDNSFITGELQLENFVAYSEIDACSFALGSLVKLNTFVQHFDSASSISQTSTFKITHIKVKLSYEYFEVYFVVGDSKVPISKRSIHTHQLFKMCLKYTSIHRLLICHASKTEFSVYFHYLECPLLYTARKKHQNKTEEHAEEESNQFISYNTIDGSVGWLRDVNLYKNCPHELRNEFVLNSVLRLEFKKPEYTSLRHLLEQLCVHVTPYFTSMKIISASRNVQITSVTSNHYDCFYALKCILTRNNEFIDQVVVQNELKELDSFFSEKLQTNSVVVEKVLAETLAHIYNQIDQGNILPFLNSVKTLYEKLIKDSDLLSYSESKLQRAHSDDQKIVYVKKGILMPCHVRFLPPQPQMYNRILRTCAPDYLIRITIRDVDLSRIDHTLKGYDDYSKNYKIKFLEMYIKRQLSNGIKLGNRKYNYLGMSSSQLRSHSMWCCAKGPDKKSIAEIRRDIGDLDEIKDVPKFMARMGLSFSQSMGRITVPQKDTNVDQPEADILGYQKIYMSDSDDSESDNKKKCLSGKLVDSSDADDEEISEKSDLKVKFQNDENLEDKKNDDDRYVFSDGIGRISEEAANKIYEELNLEDRPSAFQIRYAGCKGMLVIDPLLTEKQISFRESMKKYNSDDDSLEILKISKPRCVYLNRPLITILDQKGIHREIFLQLQKQMIHSLIKSMFYDEDAKEILNAHSQLRLMFDNILLSGISFTEDPLFRSMIFAIFRSQISLLKQRARIALPQNDARNMFGVLDETKTLKYGEVFVQYTLWNGTGTTIIDGTVLVTKNPCLHPGDVRKFEAVYVKELDHIKDCIVFPAKGHRPHPDEMAGSDLDGDEYTVIWLEDLIFDEPNSAAMHYAVPKKKGRKKPEDSTPIQVSDELDHFCNYILNDSVGRLASAHLANADHVEGGIKSKICYRLAKKHAKAVDFAKTGCPAIMTHKELAKKYPDFMEKFNRNSTYISSRALGYLYRNCKSLEIGLEATTDQMEFKLDNDLVVKNWKKYETSAQKTYQQYCKKISSCLKAYGIENEGELLSGNFIQRTKLFSDSSDVRNLLEILEFEIMWMVHKYEKEFFHEFGGKPRPPNKNFSEAMFEKASAWYVVSYTGRIFGETRYFGLPWLVSDVLVALKQTKRREYYLSSSSSSIFVRKASYVEKAIDEVIKKHVKIHDQEEQAIASDKFQILDAARTVLTKWFNLQKGCFLDTGDLKQMEKCIDDEFNSLSEELLTCDDKYLLRLKDKGGKKLLSSGYYVLATLIRISEMGTGHKNFYVSFSPSFQKFGLSAWITLIKLACSGNTQYLGISDSGGSYASLSFYNTQDMVCDIIQLETGNDKFWEIFREDEERIKTFFLEKFKMKDIALHPEIKGNNRVLYIFVKGSRFAIEHLKHRVVIKEFVNCIIDGKMVNHEFKHGTDLKKKGSSKRVTKEF